MISKIIALVVFCFSFHLQAAEPAISISPYAGYYKGDITAPGVSGNGTVKSLVAGAKLGYLSQLGLSYGIDYSQGQGHYYPAGGNEQNWNTKDIGLFVKYGFTDTLSAWVSYIPVYEVLAYSNSSDSIDRARITGDGFNVGASMRILTFFSINAEYHIRNLKEIGGQGISGNNQSQTVFISASFPVNFPYRFEQQ